MRIEERDVKVATVRLPADRGDGLDAVIVAPVEAQTRGMDLVVDPETDQVSAGLDWSVPASVPMTTGPGMGWENWSEQPVYRIELKLYIDWGDWNDYLGRAEFETTARRLLNDGSGVWDRWQIRRIGYADPQDWNKGWDSAMRVKKIWMSNDPINGARVRGWLSDLTTPANDAEICDSPGEITIPGLTWAIDNCENFSIFRGSASNDDAGHYRFSYDQGDWVGTGSRQYGYVAGYEMVDGVSASNEFYEFVTLSVDANGSGSGVLFKCKANGKGTGSTDTQSCWWNDGPYGTDLHEDWAS